MKNTEERTYTQIEVAEELRKSLYKMVKKTLNSGQKRKNKAKAKAIVADILDPNYIAEINPNAIPEDKTSVTNKAEKKGGDEKTGIAPGSSEARKQRKEMNVKQRNPVSEQSRVQEKVRRNKSKQRKKGVKQLQAFVNRRKS